MAMIVEDRVQESTRTVGTGPYVLDGPIIGFQAFAASMVEGDTVEGYIEAVDMTGVPSGAWEVGVYTMTGGQLVRTEIQDNSFNTTAPIDWASGPKRIASTLTAYRIRQLVASAASGIPGGPDKAVQYNNNGLFAGSSNLTYDSVSKVLTILNGSLSFNVNTFLLSEGSNITAQRNGLSAQIHRLYYNWTDASNYERLDFQWGTNVALIQTVAAGTGLVRELRIGTGAGPTPGGLTFQANGTRYWRISVNEGSFLAFTDNTSDIGVVSNNRPRTIYAATSIMNGNSSVMEAGGLRVGGASAIGFSTSSVVTSGTLDAAFWKDATGAIGQRNGVSSQRFRVYNTWTDASNYERMSVDWTSSVCTLLTEAAGTGVARTLRISSGATLQLGTGGTMRWQIDASGNFGAVVDNTYDIGLSANNRPRTIYAATSVQVATNVLADSTGLRVSNGVAIGFNTTNTVNSGVMGTAFYQDSSNSIGHRNGVTAQTFRVYNTWTDASNYERALIQWNANILSIGTESAGTGVARSMRVGTFGATALSFFTSALDRWLVDAAGHFLASTDNANDIGASAGNRPRSIYAATNITAASNVIAGTSFLNSATLNLGGDVVLTRDAANVLAQRNGVNAQSFRVYNTYTDGSNFERGSFIWAGNELLIGSDNAGTGVARTVRFRSGGSVIFSISSAGLVPNAHIAFSADNTYDIGATAANRPRNIFVAGAITAAYIRTTPVLFAALPAAATAGMGARAFISDATVTLTAGIGTAAAGGSTNKVPVYSDGTNWIIG